MTENRDMATNLWHFFWGDKSGRGMTVLCAFRGCIMEATELIAWRFLQTIQWALEEPKSTAVNQSFVTYAMALYRILEQWDKSGVTD